MYIDNNNDGILDLDDPVVEGATVILVDPTTMVNRTFITTSTGMFTFFNLKANFYQLFVTLPNILVQSLNLTSSIEDGIDVFVQEGINVTELNIGYHGAYTYNFPYGAHLLRY